MRSTFLVISLSMLWGVSAGYAQVPTSRNVDNVNIDLRSFGMSFRVPTGWTRVSEQGYSQLALMVRLDHDKAAGVAEVLAIPLSGKPVKDVAAALASQLGGHVVEKITATTSPAGAVEIALEKSDKMAFRRAAVLGVRDQLVLLQVGAADAAAMTAAMQGLLQSISIKEPIPAAEDLALRKRDTALFGSPLLIPLPEPFRPDKVSDKTKQMFLGVRDWKSGRDEAAVQVHLIPNANHASVEEVVMAMGPSLSAKFKVNPPMSFHKVNEKPEAWVSTVFSGDGTDSQRIVQMAFDADRIALLIFRSTAPTIETRMRYMEMAQQVAQGARYSPSYAEGFKATTQPEK